MKKILSAVIFSAIVLCSISGFAESIKKMDNPEQKKSEQIEPALPENFKYEIGFAAGLTSGVGLSFRFWNNFWGTQFTMCPYYDSETKNSFLSFGALEMYSIYSNNFSKLYMYGGGAVFKIDNEEFLNIGLGPGIELFIGNFGFNLMFGYGLYNKWASDGNRYYSTNMTGECSFFYRFDL